MTSKLGWFFVACAVVMFGGAVAAAVTSSFAYQSADHWLSAAVYQTQCVDAPSPGCKGLSASASLHGVRVTDPTVLNSHGAALMSTGAGLLTIAALCLALVGVSVALATFWFNRAKP